jgi:hypothetical protein
VFGGYFLGELGVANTVPDPKARQSEGLSKRSQYYKIIKFLHFIYE